MSLKKQFVKGKNTCKVTFSVPKELAKSTKSVHLVGEFNNWNIYGTPMKKQPDGTFAVTLELDKGREYQFRYLIDENFWENDWNADKYLTTPFGDCENSVVVL